MNKCGDCKSFYPQGYKTGFCRRFDVDTESNSLPLDVIGDVSCFEPREVKKYG